MLSTLSDIMLFDKVYFCWDYIEEYNLLRINLKCDKKYYHACYLYSRDQVLEKTKYINTGEFVFNIEKAGYYSIRIYLHDKKDNIKIAKTYELGFLFSYSKYYQLNQNLFINNTLYEMGVAYLEKSKIYFNGFEPFFYEGNSVFIQDPFFNRSWRWHLMQLCLVNQMLSVYEKTNKNDILDKVFLLLKQFENFKINYKDNADLWHDHGTALRLQNLCFLFVYLIKEKYISCEDEKFCILKYLIIEHIEKLVEEDFYSKYTNHGFDQSLILYQVCCELEYIFDIKDNINLAVNRIYQEVDFVFCNDGGHKENSPAYLNFGIKQSLSALKIEQAYSNRIRSFKYLENIINLATKVLIHTVKPDGYFPLIGDTSSYKVTNLFSSYKPECFNEFLYCISKGKEGVRPKERFFILPETGYAFYRSHWEQKDFENAIYLSFKASYHSNYHRHDDDLSITLYGYGEDWLVDGGIYKYHERDINRKYIRSHLSHNISSPDNVSALRKNNHKNKLEKISKPKGFLFGVTAESFMFHGFKNIRKILINENNNINIEDHIINNRKNEFTATTRFFFSSDKKIIIEGNVIKVFGVTKCLSIEVVCSQKIYIDLIVPIDTSEIGWLSKINNELYASKLVEIKQINSVNFTSNVNFNFSFGDILG